MPQRRGAVERHRGAAPRAGAARRRARATTCSCPRSRSWRRRTRSPTSARARCSSTATTPPGTSIPALVDEELDERGACRPAARRAARRRPLRAVRRLGPDPRVVRALRRAGDRGRRRGAGRDVPRAARGLVRRVRRVLVQRQQDHHHERRRHARGRRAPTAIERVRYLEHAGARSRAALRAHRDRLQLPDEQPARRGRARAARRPARARSTRRRAINARYRDAFADVAGHRVHAQRRRGGEPTNWLTVVTVDEPDARPRDPRAPRVARHRGPPGVEAHAPAAAVRRLRRARRRASPRRSSAPASVSRAARP